MSIMESRGGIPVVFRGAIDTSGRYHPFPTACKYLVIRAATNPCKIYFSKEDFDRNENYILVPVPATTTPHGEWQGPVEANGIWLQGLGGSSSIELVTFQRRA
jgi:hypothetical protein